MIKRLSGLLLALAALVISTLGFFLSPSHAASPPVPIPCSLPTLGPSVPPTPVPAVPKPNPTVTKYLPRPTVTVTKTKVIYRTGPARTIVETRQAPTTHVIVTPKPRVSPSPVAVPRPGRTIIIPVLRAVGISIGLFALGLAAGLVAMWLAYFRGYKDAERNTVRRLRSYLGELFGKR